MYLTISFSLSFSKVAIFVNSVWQLNSFVDLLNYSFSGLSCHCVTFGLIMASEF